MTLALSSIVFAQTSQPAVPPAAQKSDDEPVTLSVFNVTESPDRGYIASESITGTRVATQIKDLPFTISVITSEFLKDFDSFDMSKNMDFSASVNSVDTQGNSTVRGYGGIFMLRNGFYRLGLTDRINTDRIEIIKGPNAAIYGSTSPAGLINVVTKLPKFTPHQEVSYTFGSQELNRVEASATGPMGSLGRVKFVNLLSLAGSNASTNTTFGWLRNRLISDVIMAKFPDNSTLTFEFEWSKRKEVTSTSTIPFEYNNATKTYSSIQRKDLANFSQGGPDSVQNRELCSYYLTYERRHNQVWSTRASTFQYRRHAFNFNNGNSDQFDPITGKFNRATPLVDPLNEAGGAIQVDNLFEYSLFNGKIKNKTLVTLDFSENWRYRQQTAPNAKLWPVSGVSIVNPDYSLPPRWAFNIITRRDKTRWDVKGFFLRQQATMLDGRLIAFVGLRRDNVTYNMNFGDQFNSGGSNPGSLKAAGVVWHFTDTAWSPNFGANYKLTPNISLYGSHSTSFSPSGQNAKLGDIHLANETSVGWDYGIKASYFNNTLNFTAGGYYIDRYGVKTNVRDPDTGLIESKAAGTQLAKGPEFEASWRVTPDLTLLGSFSYVNVRIVYNGTAVTDVGQMPPSVPIEQASFAFKYNFRNSVLKGLSWNGGITYSGRAYPNSTAALTDARRYIQSPGYARVNTSLTYRWMEGGHKIGQSVRISVQNLLDRDYTTNRGKLGDGRLVYFAFSMDH